MAKITALYADENGEIFFAAGMTAAARIGGETVPLTEDMLIPLFFRGKNFEPGRQIDGLNIMDIAPTVAKLHGCEIPREWEGVARV